MDRVSVPKPQWVLTQEAFDALLASLASDRDHAGEQYEIVRRKLVKFFELWGSVAPEDHADEALNRVARRIANGEQVRDITAYLVGVARKLALELLKEQKKHHAARNQLGTSLLTSEPSDESSQQRPCFEKCLGRLSTESRALIVEYFRTEGRARIENRKALADRHGIQLNTLRIRIFRIRTQLETCVSECLAAGPMK